MAQASASHDTIHAGVTATIENTHSAALSISLCGDNGSRIDIELAPGQVVGFNAGDANTELLLHRGDPSGLRVIKPETAT